MMALLAVAVAVNYTSYAQFSSDISSGAIQYPYKWVMYDPEDWSQTPVNEQQDPVKYMKLFGQLAHANGLKVVEAPAMDLCSVTGTNYPRLSGQTCSQWFTRVNIACAGATNGNIFVLEYGGVPPQGLGELHVSLGRARCSVREPPAVLWFVAQ